MLETWSIQLDGLASSVIIVLENLPLMKQSLVAVCFLLFGLIAFSQQSRTTAVFLFPTAGTIVRTPIYIDGVDVAHLKPNHYLKLELAPGDHSFAAKRKQEGTECTLEPAKIYYFLIRNFGVTEGVILEPASADVAKYDMRNLQEQAKPK